MSKAQVPRTDDRAIGFATGKALPVATYGTVQVWLANLSQHVDSYWDLLGDDERARARRFAFAKDRDRFVTGRGILRCLLGRYTQQNPASLAFGYGAHGKPFLRDAPDLQFNLAHSEDTQLLAVCLNRRVGIDLEQRGDLCSDRALLEMVFTESELNAFDRQHPAGRARLFLTAWACKEAYLKATGQGLSYPPNEVEIDLGDRGSTGISALNPRPGDGVTWAGQLLPVPPPHVAALVAEGRDWTTELRTWESLEH